MPILLAQKLKLTLKRVLPRQIVQLVQRTRYARVIGRIGEDFEQDFQVVRALLNNGDAAVDLGANMGSYTKFMADCVGAAGKVYSIEPIPETFDILQHMITRMDFSHVVATRCAVSDSIGEVTLEIPRLAHGDENRYEARIVETPSSQGMRLVRTASTTVDTILVNEEREVALIKCDVEGHEKNVIKGAKRSISKFKPAWLIEIWGDPDEDGSAASKMFVMMQGFGYKAYWFDGRKLRVRKIGETSTNYFFLFPHHGDKIMKKERGREILTRG